MLKFIDRQLNNVTMYKLLLWGLRILAGVSLGLSMAGVIGQPFWGLVASLIVLIVVCGATNKIMARALHVGANTESYAITLLILFLILPPATTVLRAATIALAGMLAILSKFLVTYNHKHIFNPAAAGAASVSVLGLLGSTWWVGSTSLWPWVLVIGLLVVRKIRRFSMFITFVAVSLAIMTFKAYTGHLGVGTSLQLAFTSSPLLFLGTIMLTEPATMPPRRKQQIIFGALVALLYATAWHMGKLFIYPEVALLAGNIYAFAVSPKYRLRLKLKEIQQISDRVYNYVFIPNRQPVFAPGQYMEWTLPHAKEDSRGNRRTLSIASSPTEDSVHIGVKFYEPSSSFKQALRNLQPGDMLYAGQLAGDFILPTDTQEKIGLIAGGIGITPIRSMLKYVLDTNEQRDIVVIYSVTDPAELAYVNVLQQARAKGIRIIPLLTNPAKARGTQMAIGQLDAAFIAERIADYATRTFYVSGSEAMVQSTEKVLHTLGVHKVRTDHFSGY